MKQTLISGHELEVTPAPWKDMNDLRKAVMKTLRNVDKQADLMAAEVTIEVLTSEEVERCIFKCLERATYDAVKITPDLFDNDKVGPALREDYFAVCSAVIEVNVRPFFKSAFSGLEILAPTRQGNPA